MSPRPRHLLAIALLAALTPLPGVGHTADFAAGSLIIPMDTSYQDYGMLKAYGLVHRLLSAGIPVNQVIQPGKAQGGTDFTASALDVQTAAVIANHAYRGGPFVVDAAHASAALPVVAAWHVAGHVTSVHETTAPFSGSIARMLVDPPAIAVCADGNELIAFQNLNAAGIPDGLGQAWPTVADPTRAYPGYPDVLSDVEIAGASSVGGGEGALFGPDGWPVYCQLVSMHWSIAPNAETVREVRLWLQWPESHLYLQCTSIFAFENSSTGRFITDLGLVDDGATPSPLQFWEPDHPSAQFDGPLTGDTGSVNSIGHQAASSFRPNVSVLIEEDRGQSAPNQIQMLMITGYLDGNTSNGRATYMGGHNYSTTLPISTNPLTNGVRLFLGTLFDASCTPARVVSVDGLPSPAPGRGIRIWSTPEPFGGSTRLGYALSAAGQVNVSVFDVRGRLVTTLFAGRQSPGFHEVTWDGRLESGLRAPSGAYWVRVKTPMLSGTKRISLLR